MRIFTYLNIHLRQLLEQIHHFKGGTYVKKITN